MTQRAFVAFSCLLAFFLCPSLFGQTTGGISGTVVDKTGSVISGATVTVTSQATGITREAKTRQLRPLRADASACIHLHNSR